jgi:polyhydroxyalkanoate synthesis regulator phasin
MKDLLKNIIYAGVGAAFLTREKLEEVGRDLVEKGTLTIDEGKEFVDELLKKSDKAKEQLEQWMSCKVDERVRKCHLASSDEIAELRRKVEEMQTALDKLGKEKGCQQDADENTCGCE